MFAVIRTGGKQYRVASGDVIRVEKIPGDAGAEVEFSEVLMIESDEGPTVGQPLVTGAAVRATVLDQARGPKIIVFKKKRRQNYRRRKGHRQDLTVVRIADIYPPGAERKPVTAKPAAEAGEATPAKAAKPPKKAARAEEKAAVKKPAAKKAKEPAKKPAAKAAKPKAKAKTAKEKK
jgi:large subunit ribosomal protein L21